MYTPNKLIRESKIIKETLIPGRVRKKKGINIRCRGWRNFARGECDESGEDSPL